ncbi:MAG: bifunctional riboflavin kinase/FAD synthetase [Oscillospiraceae bacterium]|nr:bifunctional riboflavin kinase/FAD synthetase [Oscillospiraceae bacterium]
MKKSVVTIGTFDGVHKGHRFLIKQTLLAAQKDNLRSVVVALEKPFRAVRGLLSLRDEKIKELATLGVDEIVILEVPSEILSNEPEEFFNKFLIKFLNAEKIVCGADFAFGKDRKGNAAWLKKQKSVKVNIVKPLKISDRQVSSSQIRKLLEEADVAKANKLLGRNYSFSGMPFKDRGVGKKMGFPTVNLKVDAGKLLPKGIFISLIEQNGKIYPSVTSIGNRPTFKAGNHTVPETHILGFRGEWKNAKTTVSLLKKLRAEKKFKNVSDLKTQISKDIEKANKYFK